MIPAALRGPLGTAPGGVFFLHGPDQFRKGAAVDALVDAHVDPGTRDFNLDVLRGGEVDLETLASITGTPPMMAEWRVVVIRETEALASSRRSRELLLALAHDPPDGLALVLEATPPPRSSARFYKDLAKAARTMDFPEVQANDVPGWLVEWARDTHGVEMEPEAARALGAAVGTDLGQLAQEVAKLALRVEEGGSISVATVQEAGTSLPQQDRWQWFDLVGEKRFGEALIGLPVLLGHGESGVGLVIGVGTHLLRVGVAVEGGGKALEEVLPGHQRWLARRLRDQARGWTGEALEEALMDLERVDRLLKSSPLAEEHLLEEWLLRRMAREGGEGSGGGRARTGAA